MCGEALPVWTSRVHGDRAHLRGTATLDLVWRLGTAARASWYANERRLHGMRRDGAIEAERRDLRIAAGLRQPDDRWAVDQGLGPGEATVLVCFFGRGPARPRSRRYDIGP
jgi:hypothetical protein